MQTLPTHVSSGFFILPRKYALLYKANTPSLSPRVLPQSVSHASTPAFTAGRLADRRGALRGRPFVTARSESIPN